MKSTEALKYPIGQFQLPLEITEEIRADWMDSIANFHANLIELVANLSNEQRQWQYRPGGWNIAQVVHHCADSHMNSLVRFKWALTEDKPTIKPYFEERWIELADGSQLDYNDSLQLIESLHNKWVTLLKSLDADQLAREYIHPESEHPRTLEQTIGSYAWHCEHHLQHVRQALASAGEYNG